MIMARFPSLWPTVETFFSEGHIGACARKRGGINLFCQALYAAKALQILIYGAMTTTVGGINIEQKVAELSKEIEDQV